METFDEERTVELRKIPLASFIDTLQLLYDKGADYIDIIAKPDQKQDVMAIIIKEEYVDPHYNKFTEEEDGLFIPSPPSNIPLDSINLNDLI